MDLMRKRACLCVKHFFFNLHGLQYSHWHAKYMAAFTSAHLETAEQSHMKPVTTSCALDLKREHNTIKVPKLGASISCFNSN